MSWTMKNMNIFLGTALKKKKNPFKIPMETGPRYENEDYVFLVTLGKVLKPYASVSSTVKWGNTCLSGL